MVVGVWCRGRALSGCEPLWQAGLWLLVPIARIQAAAGQSLRPGGEACTEQRGLLSGWSAETWALTNSLGSLALGIGYFISNCKNYTR